MCAHAYPTRTYGRLVYAFLGEFETEEDLPDIPMEYSIWNWDWRCRLDLQCESYFVPRNDGKHSRSNACSFHTWGNEWICWYPFSPNDIIPMEKFEAINFGIGGFTMSHSPYQLYTAQKGGFDTETQRIFTPPCTMSVKSLPFFRKCLQIHAAFRNISFKSCYAPHKWLSNLYITTP